MTVRSETLNPLQIDGNRLYTTGEAAILMGVHISTIRSYIISQSVEGVKIGGNWKVRGRSMIEFIQQNAPRKTFLEYPPDQVKFPQSGYLIYRLIVSNYDRRKIIDECARWHLLKPLPEELDKLWASIKITAPAGSRTQLRAGSKYILNVMREDNAIWVERLGIKDLFGHKIWPCQNILDDASDKRLYIETMLVGRVTHKEIVNYMINKYNFAISEEQLDFFARHFFNTYNFNSQDRIIYLNRLEDRTEKYHKQRAWGDAEAARATLQIPSRVNFEEALNMIAAMATLSFRDFALGGAPEMPLAKDSAQIVFHAHRQLLALEKQRGEQSAAAIQKAQAEGPQINVFEKVADEAPSFEDLQQPNDAADKKETKAG